MEHASRAPLSRPRIGLVGWGIFALLLAVALAVAFIRARGPVVSPRVDVPVEEAPGGIRSYSSLAALTAGSTGPTLPLAQVPQGSGVIGVGSLRGLRGEVAVVRGERWLSYALPDGSTRAERHVGGDEAATFLAVADVPEWQTQTFESPIPFERLASELEQRAVRAGIEPAVPFPVLIDGRFSQIQLNVVNGPALGADTPTRERLAKVALRAALPSGEGTIVGFFANRDGDRFIHPGERLHLHVVLPAAGHVGHLDSATIDPGSVLWLPARRLAQRADPPN
jgi:alpha-acetolactate decarboxylase